MKKYSNILRTAILFLAMAAIAATLVTRLVDVQLLQSPADEARALTVTRTYTDPAARGQLLDRNGQPLVSNVLGFNIELDAYSWSKTTQNQVILNLCTILDAAGVDHSDELPLTLSPPYAYTFTGWDSQEGRKLEKLIAEQKDWPERPTAPELFSLLCGKYSVEKELLLEDKRTVVGVRYFLDMYQFSTYNNMAVLARDVDIATVARIAELGIPGVTVQEANQRQYDTTYAAHVLGRVGAISAEAYEAAKSTDTPYKLNDTLGTEGVEKTLETYLRGISGKREIEVSRATGQIIRETTVPGEEARPGSHCYLTLDLGLQQVAEDALRLGLDQVRQKGEASKDQKGADVEGGAVVVLDAKTFEVLAMASYPTFSLQTYSADFAENNVDPLRPFFNRAIGGNGYPPGSTFKMATAVAALESCKATTTEKIRDLGVYDFSPDHHPACWIWNSRRGTHGSINISQALAYSCNYYFYEVANRMGIDTLRQYASALGLGQKTGIELPGETAGMLDGPEVRVQSVNPWYPGDITSAAIGQGANQFTPLQLASYMATILGGGTRLEAHLLKQVTDYTGAEVLFQQQPVVLEDTPLKESTVQAVKEGMRGVVTDDGTASSYFRNFPIEVGGKTGSAQQPGGRSAHGVFISFAPYDDPEIVVVVIGEYAGTGGGMAPVCIEIYNKYFDLKVPVGLITPDPEPVVTTRPTAPVTTQPTETAETQDPEGGETGEAQGTDPTEPVDATQPPETEATEPPATEGEAQTSEPPAEG